MASPAALALMLAGPSKATTSTASNACTDGIISSSSNNACSSVCASSTNAWCTGAISPGFAPYRRFQEELHLVFKSVPSP
jgi:hypothetical protein